MEKILIDTDVIIDFLRGYEKRTKNTFLKIQNGQIKATVSLVSIIELYSGEDTENKKKLELLEQLLSYFDVYTPDIFCAKVAGSIRRKYKLSLADAIISASCQIQKIALFTFNTKHFKNISEIELYKQF